MKLPFYTVLCIADDFRGGVRVCKDEENVIICRDTVDEAEGAADSFRRIHRDVEYKVVLVSEVLPCAQ